jgi:hypothetical protein
MSFLVHALGDRVGVAGEPSDAVATVEAVGLEDNSTVRPKPTHGIPLVHEKLSHANCLAGQ